MSGAGDEPSPGRRALRGSSCGSPLGVVAALLAPLRSRPGESAAARWMRRALRVAAVAAALLLLVGVPLVVHPQWGVDLARRVALWRAGADTGFVEVDGARIAWAAVGSGRPILVVHGLGAESAAMMPLARALAARGFRATMIDLPGCGRSPAGPRPLTIDDAGKYAADAAKALGMGDRPTMLGHSLGGWIVAWQALARPARTGPIVLVAPAGMLFSPPPVEDLLPTTVAGARRNLALLFVRPPRVPDFALWINVRKDRRGSRDLWRSALTGENLLDGRLGEVKSPALVVAGAQDKIVPPRTAEAMARGIKDARLLVLPDAGHMLIWERADAVADAAARFLEERRDAPAAEATR